MFGSRYQRTSLVSALFENGIPAMSVEFTFILKVEVILITKYTTKFNFNPESTFYINDLLKLAFSISISNIIYTIIANVI